MKYIINGRETFDSAREAAEEIAEWLREDEYDAMLDTAFEPFIVCGAEIEASFILKRDGPDAYLRGFHDWVHKKTDEFQTSIEHMGHGNKAVIGGMAVERVDDACEYGKAA